MIILLSLSFIFCTQIFARVHPPLHPVVVVVVVLNLKHLHRHRHLHPHIHIHVKIVAFFQRSLTFVAFLKKAKKAVGFMVLFEFYV